MTATLTATTTVHITWTCAAKVRMTAKIEMPEYGLKAEQVFYLVRSSANDGTYYLLVWNYAESKWTCPCKHSVERPNAKQCRHRRLVSADCKAHQEARKAAATRIEQALDILKEEDRRAAVSDEETLRRNMTAFYDGWTAYYAKQEGLVQAPNGMWVTPEQLVNVPGAPRATYEAARYGDGVQATVNRLSRAGLMA